METRVSVSRKWKLRFPFRSKTTPEVVSLFSEIDHASRYTLAIHVTLAPGTRLGVYEIVGAIGVGGMSACGRASERSEPSPLGAGVGPRATSKRRPRAHAGVIRWR